MTEEEIMNLVTKAAPRPDEEVAVPEGLHPKPCLLTAMFSLQASRSGTPRGRELPRRDITLAFWALSPASE
jgi:hypothetical protein